MGANPRALPDQIRNERKTMSPARTLPETALGYAPMIVLHFKNSADSPTGAKNIRLRWRKESGRVILAYGRGADLTPELYATFRAAGAWIGAGDERQQQIAASALGTLREEVKLGGELPESVEPAGPRPRKTRAKIHASASDTAKASRDRLKESGGKILNLPLSPAAWAALQTIAPERQRKAEIERLILAAAESTKGTGT